MRTRAHVSTPSNFGPTPWSAIEDVIRKNVRRINISIASIAISLKYILLCVRMTEMNSSETGYPFLVAPDIHRQKTNNIIFCAINEYMPAL